jgi:transposase InsO family protein
MCWKESDRVSLRSEFVRLASAEGANRSELCSRFGISRKTGYKWLKRWVEEGDDGLVDRSRRPRKSPGKTHAAMERAILKVREKHPSWSGRKIRRRLQDKGVESPPAASTITAILHRHGCIDAAESAKHQPYGSFERETPNELWQVDFKGEFSLANDKLCYPLTILDDHSRYSLGVLACSNQKRVTVQHHFRHVFERYGLPRAIYVDNGNPWGTKGQGCGHTRFTAWLMRHDVTVIHGRPYYPQGRGKLERFHRTLKLEVLQGRQFSSFEEMQVEFDTWREVYNQERPHESLDLGVPSTRYRASDRSFQEVTTPFEYSDRFLVRRTQRYGQFRFRGSTYRVSEAFSEDSIGLAPTEEEGIWDVYYCRYRIGKLNERTETIERHQPVV